MTTIDRTVVATSQDARGGPLARLAHALTAVGVVVAMGLLLVVSPLIALYGLLADAVMDARDQVVRPRPFRGAPHGLPFLDPPPPSRTAPPETPDTD